MDVPPPKRHHPHPNPQSPSSSFPPPPPQPPPLSQPPPPPPVQQPSKPSPPPDTIFRILCPASKTGSVIGKGGAVVRHLRDETGARIRIIDDLLPPHCDERVILISASASAPKFTDSSTDEGAGGEEAPSAAQQALLRVLERILRVEEDKCDKAEERKKAEGDDSGGGSSMADAKDFAVCRLLAPSNQVGCVLGRGGKIVEKIRQDTGAQIRVFPREHLPACAFPGDELVQITGSIRAVKKALLSVSSCLQDNPRVDSFPGANVPVHVESFNQRNYSSGMHAVDYHSRSYPLGPGHENIGPSHMMVQEEEEVVFRMLCQMDKVGSLIGKGGCIIRAIENDTGASIKITDAVLPDSNERVVVISALENLELQFSPAQDAVLRVHGRISELGSETGGPVVARLLVHSEQIGYLLGKGGSIISEMRRHTGANIRIFGRERGFKNGCHNDELVQIVGSLQSVKDALIQITSRIREIMHSRSPSYNASGSVHFPPFPDLPSPHFRPRHDPSSPGHYPPPVGLPHGYEKRSAGQAQTHQPISSNQVPYPCGNDRSSSYGPSFDRHTSSPRTWNSQPASSGNPSRYPDAAFGPVAKDGFSKSGGSTTAEVVVPQTLLIHVYGENNGNLNQIKQLSGAEVVVHDPKAGATEGLIVISGSPYQLHSAQSLVQAFIFCGLPF